MEICSNIFWNLKKRKNHPSFVSSLGFTLIELLVVIGMLVAVFSILIATINPVNQYNKAQDSQREHDFGQIQRALDAYFNDNHCYPTALTFGSSWAAGSSVYMEKIPQDPSCSNGVNCYFYQTDGTSCPQWNILYASLKSVDVPANACPLVTRNTQTPCLSHGYASNNLNYCAILGNIDCSIIAGLTIGGGGGGGNPTATPTPGGPTPTSGPTPTTGPLVCPSGNYYGCTGDNRCNSIAPSTTCLGNGGTLQCYCDLHCNQKCLYN